MQRHSTRAILTLVIVIACVIHLAAQLSFEVATIRPSTSLSGGGSMGPKPGRFLAANVPAFAFITFGYNLKGYQVVGASGLSCGMNFGPGIITAGHITVATLADILAGDANVDGTVIDRTGVAGAFDVELKWAPSLEPSDLPSIFTAVQEQLGLRLQREKVPAEVLVIDRIQRPSEN